MLPNTFIAGAQKGGTTTLCYALEHHPQAIVSIPKEPAFFSRAANLGKPEAYEACFHAKAGATPRAIVDGSNAYMVDPSAPRRIHDMLGEDVRFIFCLRNPVERMVSGYWHQAKKGQETRSLAECLTFVSEALEDAVEEEAERIRHAAAHGLIDSAAYADRHDDPLWNFRYLRNSLYTADLVRFQEIFGVSRVKVVLFEDLVRDPVATLSLLATFLDLDPEGFPTQNDPHRNPTRLPRAPKLLDILRRLPGRSLMRRLPSYEALNGLLLYQRPPPTDPMLIERLNFLVAPEMAQLQTVLKRNLSALWGQRVADDGQSKDKMRSTTS